MIFATGTLTRLLINILIMSTDLTKSRLFSDMSPADLAVLAPYFSYAEFPAGVISFFTGRFGRQALPRGQW